MGLTDSAAARRRRLGVLASLTALVCLTAVGCSSSTHTAGASGGTTGATPLPACTSDSDFDVQPSSDLPFGASPAAAVQETIRSGLISTVYGPTKLTALGYPTTGWHAVEVKPTTAEFASGADTLKLLAMTASHWVVISGRLGSCQ